MVLPLLAAAAGLAAPRPPDGGVLQPAPRAVAAGAVRVEYQANVEDGTVIHGPGLTAGLGRGVTLGTGGLFRSRETGAGATERFLLREYQLGWWAWDATGGPPADLGVAAAYTDSVYERRRDGTRVLRSGERTLGLALRAARTLRWLEPGLGLQWSSRFYKIRRVRLDYLSAAASLRVRLGPLPAEVFGEWLPWIANPDRLPVPWSAGVALGPERSALLTLFATNTYGSALPTVFSAVTETIWGARVSVSWTLVHPAE